MAAMRSGRVVLVLALVVAACRSTLPRSTPSPASDEAAVAGPPLDPSVPPPHLVATASVGDPRALLDGLTAYAAALPAELQAEVAALAARLERSGFDLARPLHVLVVLDDDADEPQVVIAGGVGEYHLQLVRAVVELGEPVFGDGVVAFGQRDAADPAAAHAMWRVGTDTPPEPRFWVDGGLLARGVAAVPLADSGPHAARFAKVLDMVASVEQVSGIARLSGRDASLSIELVGVPDGALAAFAARQRPSDFALAVPVMRPGQLALLAGTMDYGDVLEAFIGAGGAYAELWRATNAVADHTFAMSLAGPMERLSIVGTSGMRDPAGGRALSERIARDALRRPIVDEASGQQIRGRPRVQKVRGEWVHETTITPAPGATADQRAGLDLWGGTLTQRQAVFGTTSAAAMGHDAAGELVRLADRLARPAPADHAMRAAVAESRGLGESALVAIDVTAVDGGTAPPVQIGMAFTGAAARVRIVVPAAQAAAIARLAADANQPSGGGAVAEMRQLADRACTCREDHACTQQVHDDFAAWLARHRETKGTERQAAEVQRLIERLSGCLGG
jgi:hypothetical protein